MSRNRTDVPVRSRAVQGILALLAAFALTAPTPLTTVLVMPAPAVQAAATHAPMATSWVTNKFPTGQPGCTGVGYPGALYYDRRDCGFGWVAVSDTANGDVVKVAFITADGATQGAPQVATWRAADSAWQFSFTPGASWPAGPVTIRVVEVKGQSGNFGETRLFLNALGATVGAASGSFNPGQAIPVSGTTYEIDQIPPLAGQQTTAVGATFKLQVVWPDGTVKGPFGPFSSSAGPLNAGTFSATLPGSATAGLTADASTNYRATVGIEVVDVASTDAVTGAWASDRAGAGSLSFTLAPSTLLVENSFVSAVGWVKPGDSYPFRILVRNYSSTARTGATVTVPVPDGTTFTSASAVSGSGTCSIVGGNISWTIGTVGAAVGGVPAIKTCVVQAKADSLAQDPQIVWKNLSSTATLTYAGGPSGLASTSHGPKVIPPAATYDTARYGDRPFPVVPVDWHDRPHEPAHTGDALSDKINSPSIKGSTFNLYQEMSYGQLYPDGDVPSAGIATAGWTYAPGFQFTTPEPGGTCAGVTYAAVQNTALYPERIVDGWYQMPGDTGYYGSDGDGSALVGAESGVGPLQMIDNGCGPTGKAVFDAAQIADPEIDYSDFDTDKDGVVDFFMMVFAGAGGNGASQTSVPPYDNIWPHSSSLESYYTNQGPYGQTGYVSDDQLKDLEGYPLYYTTSSATQMTRTVTPYPVYVRVGPYNVNPEDAIDHASVISHEYGHSLGLPDFYSIGSRSTYGDWNLMATDKSQNMDVFGKQELGWLIPRVIPQGTSDVTNWQDSKANTHRIDWQQPDGTPYTLSGGGVNNGQAYVAKLPTTAIIDPATFDAAGPGVGASPSHAWWSQSGNDFGCAPTGGHNLDIYLPELANVPAGTPITLTFKSDWDMEWDYDFGFVMLSTDGGTTYTSLPSANNYTTSLNPQNAACQAKYGNGITGASGSFEAGTQNADRLTSTYPASGFLADQYDLSAGAGSQAVLRFSYSTDPGVAHPGWFIDDVKVTAGSQVIFDSNLESSGGPDDPRVFNGGCKTDTRVTAQCTKGWQLVDSSQGSPADHGYYLELRDRSGFDADGHGQIDRDPIGFSPGVLLVYTDETHGYGNYGTPDPPAQTPLDAHPQPGSATPNLNDAAFTASAGGNHFSDGGAGWTDNYADPASADGNWHLAYDCLSFDVLRTSGLGVGPVTVPPYDISADVRFTLGPGCARFDYGHGGPGGPVNAAPTAVADARPTTVATGDPVTFDGSASFDDHQTAAELTYAWDLDGNGTFETPGQVVSRSYAMAGDYTATLRVTDADGLSATDSVTIHVTGVEGCPALTPTGSYATDFEGATTGWSTDAAVNALPTSLTWQVAPDPLAHSGTKSFFSDATTLDVKDDRLVSPAVDLSTTSQLIFWHRYGFEATFDGGVLEVSSDGGSTWTDVLAGGGSFAEGGYDGSIASEYSNPLAGRSAWTDVAADGAANPMTRVVVNLGAFAGSDVRVRFRLATDPAGVGSLPGAGWWIDDVSFTNLLEPATCADNPPLAVDDTAITTTDTPVTINVVANDGDPDGDPITIADVADAAHGTTVDNGDGTVTYTPDAGYSGSDGFGYTISDGRGGTDSANVAVTVTSAGNRPPIASDDAATTVEDHAVTVAVLDNDTDPDGDQLMVTDFGDPGHGSVAYNQDSTLTYTPDAGYVGDDDFTYTAGDGRGGTDTATVTITVTAAPNAAPTAANDVVSTSKGESVRVFVTANDTDPDGDDLTVTAVTAGGHGSTTNNHDGTVTYTPASGFTGTDTFQYTISDGHGHTDSAKVTVNVLAPGDTTSVTGGGSFRDGGATQSFNVNAQAKKGVAKGKIAFDRDGGISLKGSIDAVQATSSTADITGSCTLADGASCTFAVHVEDVAEPGAGYDRFTIHVYDAAGTLIYEATGTLTNGNIQVH